MILEIICKFKKLWNTTIFVKITTSYCAQQKNGGPAGLSSSQYEILKVYECIIVDTIVLVLSVRM